MFEGKLSYYFYKSQYQKTINSQNPIHYSGLILKGTDFEGNSGYSSYHCIENLNQDPMQIVSGFQKNQLSENHYRIIQYLNQDLQNRKLGFDSLVGAFELENHKLIPNCLDVTVGDLELFIKEGFRFFKIKMGRQTNLESEWIHKHHDFFKKNSVQLRLDFNESFLPVEFELWTKNNKLHESGIIDYYEDPTPYHPDHWRKWQKQGLRLAKDFLVENQPLITEGVKVLVLKPSVLNPINELKKIENPMQFEYVITHFMDSPFAIAQATANALKLKFFVKERLKCCGLLPAENFCKSLDWQIDHRGPYLLFPEGKGLGFTEELEKLTWKTC